MRRKLVISDLERMRIPKRYWNAKFDEISDYSDGIDDISPRRVVKSYLEKYEEIRKSGTGLLLWGDNGTGKTSIAAVLAKEFRRRYCTVFFVDGFSLRDVFVQKEMFDEDQTCWQRAATVDVLIIDDLGKGIEDNKGFGRRVLDDLIRVRNGNALITIITTNVPPKTDDEKKDSLEKILSHSTMQVFREHLLSINVRGKNLRNNKYKSAEKLIFGR